jgi:hypothetical protein
MLSPGLLGILDSSSPTTLDILITCFITRGSSPCAPADTGTEDIIPLPNVPGKILAKVIEYCKFHVEANKKVDDKPAKSEDDIKQWDTEFVKVDQATLFDLILVSSVPPSPWRHVWVSCKHYVGCLDCDLVQGRVIGAAAVGVRLMPPGNAV